MQEAPFTSEPGLGTLRDSRHSTQVRPAAEAPRARVDRVLRREERRAQRPERVRREGRRARQHVVGAAAGTGRRGAVDASLPGCFAFSPCSVLLRAQLRRRKG